MEQYASYEFPAAVLRPGHLVGPGWVTPNPAAHFDPQIFCGFLALGYEVCLSNSGRETVHHGADVAQAFVGAKQNWSHAMGESFSVASPSALTLAGYAASVPN